MDADEFFARNVKAIREARGLTQEKLSQLAGLGVNHVTNIEGDRRGARLRSAANIARALGVTIDDLVREDIQTVLNRLATQQPKVGTPRGKRRIRRPQ